jgi:hypothetical protein
MDADSAVSADLVLVALSAPRSRPPPALPCHVTRAGPPPVGPVRSTLFWICQLCLVYLRPSTREWHVQFP